ncbi:MAG: glycosyltransferase [Ornithinimicrobium sp.]
MLVYNHAAHDSRVLKTAASLRSAGADVRIFGVARARAGYAEGPGLVGDHLEVDRAPEFELARYAPRLLRLARGLTRRPDPVPDPTVPAPPGEGAQRAPGFRVRRRPAPPGRIVEDLWLRAYRTLSLALYWWHADRAARAWGPDAVHACDGNTLVPAMSIARVAGAAIVYDSHELWLHRNVRSDRPVAPCVEGAIEWAGVRRAAGVITVSPSIAAWLQRRYRLRREPTLVRNTPAAPKLGGSATSIEVGQQASLRERAGLGEDTTVVAYAGRITTARGLEETLAALSLMDEGVHLVLLGYGEPDYLATLRARIVALGLAPRVHVVEPVYPDHVPMVLATADLSVVIVRPVCLSYRFSLPNKLFESVHAGVPVVAADLPDLADLVRRFRIGEVVDVSTAEDLAASMTRVLADPGPYRQAARAAAQEFTWAGEEVTLLALYRRVLQR